MSNDEWGAGDRANWSSHGLVKVGAKTYPLIYGEHPHSRRDNQHYVEMGGKAVGFDGHRVCIGVQIESDNYLKSSYLSGDEVRKSVSCKLLADGVVVFEFSCRDVQYALLKAHALITELSEHSSGWLNSQERERLVGRKVFYREHPGVVTRLVMDQGCVIIETEDGKPFPPPIWRDADDDEGEPDLARRRRRQCRHRVVRQERQDDTGQD